MRILLVEDDEVIRNNLAQMLRRESYSIDAVSAANEGYEKARDEEYDLIILDWILGEDTGIELLKKLRAEKTMTPILMLTAKSGTGDKIEGLDSGADDYLTKPFAYEELSARVRTLLRRKEKDLSETVIKIADLSINTNTRTVERGGRKIELSPKEYALLFYLAVNSGKALERMDIMSHVWDESVDLFSNTVDVHITYLRKKIDGGFKKKLIQTVKNKGYMICA